VPRDISIVGYDDTPIATTVWPELTTIRQPIASMAEAAINLLLQKIRRPKDRYQAQVDDQLVPFVLVKRDSVAPPRKS
jgi:LacI family transcriptional regulator